MNVTKMRKAASRGVAVEAAAAEVRRNAERELWLSTLDPDHRARHERGDRFGGGCFRCFTDAVARRAVSDFGAFHASVGVGGTTE